ncbi:uncharacterized protein LOC117336613 [Pecten maximus]|uniref:uncharacterized protein LOC117336613 n=1 Tax=Pecten maximus TaxID=6579 RepID=UPI0014580585|nr:uncharacterized protein LOC117336613 [Pecten maximus]
MGVSWLCSKLKYDTDEPEDGMVDKQQLYELYKKQCDKHSVKSLSITCIAKIVCKLFPDIKFSRIRTGGKSGSNNRKNVFKGISFCGLSHDNIEFITVENLQLQLDESCFLSSRTHESANILMPTNISANGNMLMKEICLNFSNMKWQLNVRGKSIDLSNLGISDKFDRSVSNFKTILRIVKSLDLCVGCDKDEKTPVPNHILCEHVTLSENGQQTTIKKLRSLHCLGVISWFSIKDVCSRCRHNLQSFISNPKENENTVNLDAVCDKDSERFLAVRPL